MNSVAQPVTVAQPTVVPRLIGTMGAAAVTTTRAAALSGTMGAAALSGATGARA